MPFICINRSDCLNVSTVPIDPGQCTVCSSAFAEPDLAYCNCPSDCSTASYTTDLSHAALPSLSVDRKLTSNVNSLQKHYHRALELKHVSCVDIQTYVVLSILNRVEINSINYSDVIMGAMESQIPSHIIVYSTVYSDAYQRKHQSSASLAFVRGIPRTNGQ